MGHTPEAEAVDICRDLIRIDTSNYGDDSGPGERKAAEYVAASLAEVGIESEIFESESGRSSLVARWGNQDSAKPGLLIHGHLDVVPAQEADWKVAPFAAEVIDGYLFGRGAVDMKEMVALEIGVVRLLAADARVVGLDPATDPIPGLRRDVLFTCTADEEAGGVHGAKWIAENRPDWLQAAGALNECGGV
ncbi:MAG: hypothetical protein QOJ72_74, partial [Nocardioidaceae bacterium]|nr:hypothetical protein [Nocardioidaceae bacterium]